MFERDDLDPIKKPPSPRDLQRLSREELAEYIATLKLEIVRAEEMITRKQAHQNQASSLFKS